MSDERKVGYRNVRRGRGKKSREEGIMSAGRIERVSSLGIADREHIAYRVEGDEGLHRLMPWVQGRIQRGRKLTQKRTREARRVKYRDATAGR